MIYAFLTGFILGFSLILVIGAQNSFVLRQGLIGRHVFIGFFVGSILNMKFLRG